MDVSRYATVEDCLAATWRIHDSVDAPHRFEIATRPKGRFTVSSLPPEVVDAARRCSARWPVATAPLADFPLLLRLYLQAGRDADAKRLVERQLAGIPAHDDSAMAATLDIVAGTYLSATPKRIAEGELILAAYARLPRTTSRVFRRIGLLLAVYKAADQAGDTLHARVTAEQLVQLSETVDATDRQTDAWVQRVAYEVHQAIDYLSRLRQLDSLRRSSASYATLVRANWARVSPASGPPIGEHAPPLVGEFWFEPGVSHPVAPSHARPTSGALSIITFFSDCHAFVLQCWETYAVLQRLHQRFPDVELTIATQTRGYFLDQEPPTPEVEAELYRHWWLDVRHLPATLVVERTSFTRIPAPDRRRMNQATANQINYSFGGRWKVGGQMSFVVDRDGVVVEAAVLDRDSEERFGQSLDVLQNRAR